MLDRTKYAKIDAYADECITFINDYGENVASDGFDKKAFKEVSTVLMMMKTEMDFLVNDLDRVLTTAQKNDALAASNGALPPVRSLKEFAGQTFGAQVLGNPGQSAANDFRKYVENFAIAQQHADALGVSKAEKEKKLKEIIAAQQQAMVAPKPSPVSSFNTTTLSLDGLDDEEKNEPVVEEAPKEYVRDTSKWADDGSESYSGHGGDSGGGGASASYDTSTTSDSSSSSFSGE